MKKIVVIVPTFENIYPDTMKCIWDLKKPGDYELDFDFVRGYSVDRARNMGVQRAMKLGGTHILFVDNDMTFDPDFLDKLAEHDQPVVMGYYDHRSWDPKDDRQRTNLCKLGQFNYLEQVTPEEVSEANKEGYDLIQVKGGGLGFALIDLQIFSEFKYPWFDFIEYVDGNVLSEDLYFSEQCKWLGIPIYADTRCYCGHIFRQRHGGNETVHQD